MECTLANVLEFSCVFVFSWSEFLVVALYLYYFSLGSKVVFLGIGVQCFVYM
jgi:hypothetical protein